MKHAQAILRVLDESKSKKRVITTIDVDSNSDDEGLKKRRKKREIRLHLKGPLEQDVLTLKVGEEDLLQRVLDVLQEKHKVDADLITMKFNDECLYSNRSILVRSI